MSAYAHPCKRTPAVEDAARPASDAAGRQVELAADASLCLRQPLGLTLQVLEGVLWVSQDGDIRDLVLAAGDSLRVERNAPLIVSPLGKATARLVLRQAGSQAHAAQSAQAAQASAATA
ncbi:Protein of unknown function [Noviherbaspirillum humi]|uniref:DUF2917 domain-containing protein n=1 Tax=Noviherbaspirillum humi TaxID=1688639 RepID=A0A239IZR2_9BURK|nr:DUF2917 domain-containing protein [Noviherbaspirillum humi]SNS99015.1 Protein of unknown function [Noviherbaspirillum humi]